MRGRIRSVKPEVLKDEDLWDLEQETGMPLFRAFEGLWMYADREGRFEWRPRVLKIEVLPFWEGDFSRVLDALTTRGFVVRYKSAGRDYGWVRTFKRHQAINNKEPESELPDPNGKESTITVLFERVNDAWVSRVSPPLEGHEGNGNGRERKGTEGEGIGNGDCDGVAKRPPSLTPEPAGTSEDRKAAWMAYALAYRKRYRIPPEDKKLPTRNAKVNGQLQQFCSRVPMEDWVRTIEHYVWSQNQRYVAARHSVGCLLEDAEKLHAEALTGTSGTASAARRTDRNADRGQQYGEVFARLDAEEAAGKGLEANGQ